MISPTCSKSYKSGGTEQPKAFVTVTVTSLPHGLLLLECQQATCALHVHYCHLPTSSSSSLSDNPKDNHDDYKFTRQSTGVKHKARGPDKYSKPAHCTALENLKKDIHFGLFIVFSQVLHLFLLINTSSIAIHATTKE